MAVIDFENVLSAFARQKTRKKKIIKYHEERLKLFKHNFIIVYYKAVITSTDRYSCFITMEPIFRVVLDLVEIVN